MKLTKIEYKILYLMERVGLSSLEKIKGFVDISEEETKKTVIKLESLGLAKRSEFRGDNFYGFTATPKGNKLLKSKEYEEWFMEFGD